MRIPIVTALAAAALLCAACSAGPDARISNTGLGTAGGVLAGGIIGSQFGKGNGKVLGTVVGVVAGGIIGNDLGRKLDQRDRALAQEAEYDALERGESGQARRWIDPDTGHYGDIVPTRPYQRDGRDCRDYTHTVYVDGRPETARATACRGNDGVWSTLS